MQTTKPMLKEQVFKTTDYFLFKKLGGNRDLNLLHLKRLMKSMQEKYLFSPIIINENFEVIDGQHRLEAAKALQLPVYYITVNGYGLKEVQIFNANSKTWNATDFMEGYCDSGYEDYKVYREFRNTFDFDHNTCMHLLAGSDTGSLIKQFYSGNFKIKNYPKALDKARKIASLKDVYENYKRRSFLRAIINLMNNKSFDFQEFAVKLKNNPTMLKDCATQAQYKEQIENVYNYRRKDKVNLRY